MIDAALTPGRHRVALEDVELSYTVSGSGPLLFAVSAGWGPGSSYLTRGLEPLTLDFTLVAIATRGSEESSRPRDEDAMGSADVAHDVEDLRRHLGLSSIDLLGHFTGGAVAISFAAQFPDACRKLVLVDSQVIGFDGAEATQAILDDRRADTRFGDAVTNFEDTTPVFDDEAFTRWPMSFFPLYFHDPHANLQRMVDTFDVPIKAWCAEKQWSADRQSSAVQLEQLAAISADTLTLVCKDDFITPVPVSERLLDGIGNARLRVIPDCGHFPWIEQPYLFFHEVPAFLNDTPLTRADARKNGLAKGLRERRTS